MTTFKKTIKKIPQLNGYWRAGLEALRKEDKRHMDVEDPRQLRGSVDIDTANLKCDPHGNRWDFAIAYKHANRKAEVIYWVEFHTASDSEVKVVIKKALWLQNWLKGIGKQLVGFEKDIVWVSSGATSFTLSSPQKKQMAQIGLQHVGHTLRIKNIR